MDENTLLSIPEKATWKNPSGIYAGEIADLLLSAILPAYVSQYTYIDMKKSIYLPNNS